MGLIFEILAFLGVSAQKPRPSRRFSSGHQCCEMLTQIGLAVTRLVEKSRKFQRFPMNSKILKIFYDVVVKLYLGRE